VLREFECRKPVNIYVVGADGGRVRRVTSNAKASSLLWSPDGRSIVVTQTDDTGEVSKAEVDVIGVGGGQLRQLATDASALASSPDGRRLLFSRRDDLWVMDADGAGRRGFPLTIAG
jgi:Tol biopolymer transport system component